MRAFLMIEFDPGTSLAETILIDEMFSDERLEFMNGAVHDEVAVALFSVPIDNLVTLVKG